MHQKDKCSACTLQYKNRNLLNKSHAYLTYLQKKRVKKQKKNALLTTWSRAEDNKMVVLCLKYCKKTV